MATYSRKRAAHFDLDLPLTRRPFDHTTSNPRTRRLRTTPLPAPKPRLTQLTIDLGGSPQRRCKECGMEYVPANPEDAKLHKQHHALHIAGICVTKAFWTQVRTVWRGARREPRRQPRNTTSATSKRPEREDCIVEVTRKDAAAARNIALRLVDVMERELGAVPTSEQELWDCVEVDKGHAGVKGQERYKVYVYIQDNRCVGCLLAERISAARRVCVPLAETAASPITASEENVPAVLGVSRIWVSSEWRQRGVAHELLRAALAHFVREGALQRTDMAFSQPTESGTALARVWFGAQHGWLVYA